MRELKAGDKAYVTVWADNQFPYRVDVAFDKAKAVEAAKSRAAWLHWRKGEEHPEAQATTDEDAVIYHAQEEEDRCEKYVSVFETIIGEDSLCQKTP